MAFLYDIYFAEITAQAFHVLCMLCTILNIIFIILDVDDVKED